MEYKVRISLSISSIDGERFASGYMDKCIPFIPFIGLVLSGESWYTEPIESISYDIENQSFLCRTQQREHECDDGTFIDIDFLINDAKKHGWKGFETVFKTSS
ncbi:MAG: hypothetical protein C4530_09915 [Desulfobacteraceae bacterium]|nr:MAG: hypothetical protein C4530_09915 [Desulfobacteraceae bacterium]